MQNEDKGKLLSRSEAAVRLHVSKAALEAWAHRGIPRLPYKKIGNKTWYRESDVEEFLAARTFCSAAEHRAAAALA